MKRYNKIYKEAEFTYNDIINTDAYKKVVKKYKLKNITSDKKKSNLTIDLIAGEERTGVLFYITKSGITKYNNVEIRNNNIIPGSYIVKTKASTLQDYIDMFEKLYVYLDKNYEKLNSLPNDGKIVNGSRYIFDNKPLSNERTKADQQKIQKDLSNFFNKKGYAIFNRAYQQNKVDFVYAPYLNRYGYTFYVPFLEEEGSFPDHEGIFKFVKSIKEKYNLEDTLHIIASSADPKKLNSQIQFREYGGRYFIFVKN